MNRKETKILKNSEIWVQSARKIKTLTKEMCMLEESGHVLTATFLALPLFELMLFLRLAIAYPEDDLSKCGLAHLVAIAVYSGKEAGLRKELEQAKKFRNSVIHGKGFVLKSQTHLREEYKNVKTIIISLEKSVENEVDGFKKMLLAIR